MIQTSVIALSADAAQRFRSNEPYVVIQITDPGDQHPILCADSTLLARMGAFFHDVLPENAGGPDDFEQYIPMSPAQAAEIASFVKAWHGKVDTIVVHCRAGLSRSVGVAIAIREHYRQNVDELFEFPRSPNAHCRTLMNEALSKCGQGMSC